MPRDAATEPRERGAASARRGGHMWAPRRRINRGGGTAAAMLPGLPRPRTRGRRRADANERAGARGKNTLPAKQLEAPSAAILLAYAVMALLRLPVCGALLGLAGLG
jgi:hypothetical protein